MKWLQYDLTYLSETSEIYKSFWIAYLNQAFLFQALRDPFRDLIHNYIT